MMAIFGKIEPPPGIKKWEGTRSGAIPGLIPFLSALVKLLIVVGGLYAFFNIIFAGFGFLGAGDDPKKVEAAWAKIWQSLVGLLFIAGAFVLAAIFGYLIFGDPMFILYPKITVLE